MKQSNEFFATAKPISLFFAVAMPGMVSMLSASVYAIIEGVFIGQFLGETAFAAVNLAMPFVLINFSLADLIGVGSSVPIAIALGQKDHKRANNIFSFSILLIFLSAIFMGALLFFASPYILKLMGAEGELAALAVKYVRVYALVSPITTIVFAIDNYLRICGFVKSSMFINILMTFLTGSFIFLFIVILKFEVEGSALASSISMSICTVIAFIPFLRKKTVLKFVKPKPSRAIIKDIVACGSPVFLNNVSGRVASILMNTMLLYIGGASLGQTAVAAYSVLMYASGIIEPLLYGMSDSVQPAIGYNWGAKKLPRVKAIAKCAFISCGIVSLIGTVLMFLFPEQISALFVKKEETVLLEMSVHALKLFCSAYLFKWVTFAVQSFFSAINKPLPASILSFCSAMVFPVVFIFALLPLGLDGMWLNMTATSLVVMIMALIMLRASQKKIAKDIYLQ